MSWMISGGNAVAMRWLQSKQYQWKCSTYIFSPSRWVWISLLLKAHLTVCRFLGVPPGRGSCPLTGPLPFDLIYTDYHGLQQMKQHMGLSLRKHKSVSCSLSLSFFVSCHVKKCHFCFFQSSKCIVCLLHPFPLQVIAFLMKYFTIGLLAGWCYRPVTLLCVSKNSPIGWIQFGLFTQRSIKQVQPSGSMSLPLLQPRTLCALYASHRNFK